MKSNFQELISPLTITTFGKRVGTAQGGMKPSDYTLLGEIKKGSKESISIVPTTNNVVIGVRKTEKILKIGVPRVDPLNLNSRRIREVNGISYYGNKTLVGGNIITNGREIDWTNKKWRQAGSNNFITQTKNGHLVTNKQYIFKLSDAPKYVYSLWSVDAKVQGMLEDHPGHPSIHMNYERPHR